MDDGVWMTLFFVYFCWPSTKITRLEDHNKILNEQLEQVNSRQTFPVQFGDIHFTRENVIVGLTENHSNWYNGFLKYGFKPWPAIGCGFNTGVILMCLGNLRKLPDWDGLWRKVAYENLAVYANTKLADQDIFNAIIKKQPHLLHRLPCVWNVQLSSSTMSDVCYRESNYVVKVGLRF